MNTAINISIYLVKMVEGKDNRRTGISLSLTPARFHNKSHADNKSFCQELINILTSNIHVIIHVRFITTLATKTHSTVQNLNLNVMFI